MTTAQQRIVWAGIGLVALALTMPPWKFTLSRPQLMIERPGPYAFVFSPPDIPRPTTLVRQIREKYPEISRQYADDDVLAQKWIESHPGDAGLFGASVDILRYPRDQWSVHIDFARLLLPVGAIAVGTLGLLVVFRNKTA